MHESPNSKVFIKHPIAGFTACPFFNCRRKENSERKIGTTVQKKTLPFSALITRCLLRQWFIQIKHDPLWVWKDLSLLLQNLMQSWIIMYYSRICLPLHLSLVIFNCIIHFRRCVAYSLSTSVSIAFLIGQAKWTSIFLRQMKAIHSLKRIFK